MEATKQSVNRSGNLNPMFGKRQSLETKQKSVTVSENDMQLSERQLESRTCYNLPKLIVKHEKNLYINS